MKFKHKNCSIIIDDGTGTVYRDGRLMFRGDGYIAIKTMLQFTDNAEEVKNHFNAQLSMREKSRWSINDDKAKATKRMKEEAERAKQSFSTTPQTKKRKPKSTWEKFTR